MNICFEAIHTGSKIVADIVKTVCPMSYEAFTDYSLNSVQFSAVELRAVKDRLSDISLDQEELVERGLSKREAAEFLEKLRKIREL